MKKTSSTAEAVDPRGIVAELCAHPPTRAEVKNFSETGLLIAPDPSEGQQEPDYMAWAEKLRTGPLAVSDGGAAFVDTTTLHSALPLLRPSASR